MSAVDYRSSLARLVELVPPPAIPLEFEQPPAALSFAGDRPVTFPPDYVALIEKYGSGEFNQDGHVGMIASVHNPQAPAFLTFLEREHASLREYKQEEGGGYGAYEIFPDTPGLLEWGWAEGRKAYFWLTEGAPEKWPLIVMWDFEFFGRFDMPVVVFLERLVGGQLDARFLGDETVSMRLDHTRISFIARPMLAG
jgi:hypothetical protein